MSEKLKTHAALELKVECDAGASDEHPEKVIPDELYAALQSVNPNDTSTEARQKIAAALTLEEHQSEAIHGGLAIEENQEIAAAMGTDSQDADDTTNDDTGFTFPIKTSWAVLFEFQKQLNDNTRFLENPKPLNISALNMISDNVEYHIRQMNFERYCQMRELQRRETNLLLQQLRLAIDADTGETESTDNPLRQAANKYLDRLGIGPSIDDRKKYLEMMLALFEAVSISVERDATGQQVAHIKKDNKTLITMTETIRDGLNNMTFKFSAEVLNYKPNDPNDMKQLKDAVELCVDQATRLLERSQDKKKRRFHISGYEDSPELVLQMYQSALLHELKPTIDQATLAEWDRISQDSTHPKNKKYTQAKALYDKMNEISADKKLNKSSKLNTLRKLATQKILKQDPQQADPINNQTTPTITAQLKVK